MKKKTTGLGLVIPDKMRIGGVTFYKRQGQVIGRVSESHQKRSNTLPQFIQRQRMRHTIALWQMLKFCNPMFTERGNAYQDFASIANRLPAVYYPQHKRYVSFLMPGIPVSNGTLPPVSQHLGEVNGTAALLTDLKPGERHPGEELWLYTAEQHLEEAETPRVRFSKRQLKRSDMTTTDGTLSLVSDDFADPMKGWTLVRIVKDRCSPQTIQTRCTLYQQYTTDEALQEAAKTYGGLTETPFLSPR